MCASLWKYNTHRGSYHQRILTLLMRRHDTCTCHIQAHTHVSFQQRFLLLTHCSLTQDVLKLEESVQELHQMFADFALLADQQGELLDQIEYQVNLTNTKVVASWHDKFARVGVPRQHAHLSSIQVRTATEYVGEGNTAIEKASDYQKSIRKQQCCVIAIVVVLCVAILAGVGAFG